MDIDSPFASAPSSQIPLDPSLSQSSSAPTAAATPAAPRIRLVSGSGTKPPSLTPKASTSKVPLKKKPVPAPPARRPSTRSSTGALRPLNIKDGAPAPAASTSLKDKNARVKLKLKKGGPGQAHYNALMQGYDRELDDEEESDYDEPLHFDEHFILRMPDGEDAEKLREMIRNRSLGKKKKKSERMRDGAGGEGEKEAEDVWFRFKDSRRAVFGLGKKSWNAKLVDLPCIIESSKTLDNRHLFKVGDISQMLILDADPIPEDNATNSRPEVHEPFNIEDYVYPHGITPPMHHVRKRRFKKRVSKRTIEEVERVVEKLLQEDQKAERHEWELVPAHLDDSDEDIDQTIDPQLGGEDGSPMAFDKEEEDEEDEGDFDPELQADIEKAMAEFDDDEAGAAGAEKDTDGDGGLFGSEDEDDSDVDSEDEEDREEEGGEEDEAATKERQRLEMLEDEITDLEDALTRKRAEVGRAANPIIKKRFEDQAKKLASELEHKRTQVHTLSQSLIRRKEERIEQELVQQQEAEEKAAEAAELERTKSATTDAAAETQGQEGTKAAEVADGEKKDDRMEIDPTLLSSEPTTPSAGPTALRHPTATANSSLPKSNLSSRPQTPAEEALRRARVQQIEQDRMAEEAQAELESRMTDLRVPDEPVAETAAQTPAANAGQEEVSSARIDEILRDFFKGQAQLASGQGGQAW
ncbi:hypothetical protein BT69DRAFT_1346653 [Atractiella rhizophila]|nr:hypothetical protein BT69DRAFT_1346653 [Atractiella rhizophila]